MHPVDSQDSTKTRQNWEFAIRVVHVVVGFTSTYRELPSPQSDSAQKRGMRMQCHHSILMQPVDV